MPRPSGSVAVNDAEEVAGVVFSSITSLIAVGASPVISVGGSSTSVTVTVIVPVLALTPESVLSVAVTVTVYDRCASTS